LVRVDARAHLGRAGEDAAAALLERSGLRVLDRNFRCSDGELDIVARRGRLLVFCEVKTRRTELWGDPSEAVHFAKRNRLRRLAAEWMRVNRPGDVDVRFDVVSVIVRGARTDVRHLPDAF
jgi:putative endonuclease